MARPALRIEVTTKDQKALRKLLSIGVQQVRVVLRAVALLQLAKCGSAPRVAAVVPLTPQAIRKVGHRYQQGHRHDDGIRRISGQSVSTSTVKKSVPANTSMCDWMNSFQLVVRVRSGAGAILYRRRMLPTVWSEIR